MEDISFDEYDQDFYYGGFMYHDHTINETPEAERHATSQVSDHNLNCEIVNTLNFESIKNKEHSHKNEEFINISKIQDPNVKLLQSDKLRCNSITIDYVDDYDYSKDIKHKIDLEGEINQVPLLRKKSSFLPNPSISTTSTQKSEKPKSSFRRAESCLTQVSGACTPSGLNKRDSFTSDKRSDNEPEKNNFISELPSYSQMTCNQVIPTFMIKRIDRRTGKYRMLTKHRKIITNCKHPHEEYYAKGMCRNCYHNKGQKSKKAFKCSHTSVSHYARGLCKNCYLYSYHHSKKDSDNEKSAELCKNM